MKSATYVFAQKHFPKEFFIPKFVIDTEEAEGRLQTQFKQSSKFIDFPDRKINSYR